MATVRRKMIVEYDDDAELSRSRKEPGKYSPLTRDGDKNLGHVILSDVDDEDGADDDYTWDRPSPNQPNDDIDYEAAIEGIVVALTLLAKTIEVASPYVKQWWSTKAHPALSDTKAKVASAARRRLKKSTTDRDEKTTQGVVTSTPSPDSGLEQAGLTMTRAEAEQRFRDAVVAAAFARDQMDILRNARIVDEDSIALANTMREISPERVREAVRQVVEADPSIISDESLAVFGMNLRQRQVELEPVARDAAGPSRARPADEPERQS